jgi:hypothetical protein
VYATPSPIISIPAHHPFKVERGQSPLWDFPQIYVELFVPFGAG